MANYRDFVQKYIPSGYGYTLTLDSDYKYANLWLANVNAKPNQQIYLPFKYYDLRLYFVMSGFNEYKKWNLK